ncbi:MAG: DNA repair protein RecO [Defluviitaleaceae bacterium]|nr:DNA repair protein RecO [Defluviitaleaceae bacterium]
MAIIKDFGVVLREYAAGESNKKLVLLTRRHGKISAFARGSQRVGSKLATSLFCYNEFVIFDGGSFLSLNQVLPIHTFGKIADDYDKYCFCCCFLELADKMLLTGMETGEALQILLRAFAEMEHGRLPANLIFAGFVFKFLQKEGLAPIVNMCAACEGELIEDCWFYDEGLFCDVCATSPGKVTPQHIGLSAQAVLALQYILDADVKRMFAFKVSEGVASQLYAAAGLFLSKNVDVELKSLKTLTGIR